MEFANRKTVMKVIRELDPEKVALQRKKRLLTRVYSVPGPDLFWHQDGYDKLKPFGFSTHGCIDGYSRKLYGWRFHLQIRIHLLLQGIFRKQ